MLAVQQNAQFQNTALPKISTSARQARILANAAPTLWLKPDSAYFQTDTSGNCAAWFDAANPRSFVPIGSNPPAVTALAHSANSFLTFNGAGSALFDPTLANILPADGTPGMVAALVLNTSSAGTFGGPVIGSPLPAFSASCAATTTSGSPNLTGLGAAAQEGMLITGTGIPIATYLLSVNAGAGTGVMSNNATASGSITATVAYGPFGFYINSSTGTCNLQGEVGESGDIVSGTSNIANGAWTTILGSYTGSAPGAIAQKNGTTETTSTNLLRVSTAATALQALIGGYGPAGATNPAKMQIAAIMVASVDLTLAANASILADINAEFAAYQSLLAAG